MKASSRGFTLIELLVVIAIIGILASTILASLGAARKKAQIAAVQQQVHNLYLGVDAARLESGKTLIDIVGTNYSTGPCYGHDNRNEPTNDPCYQASLLAFTRINAASGGMLDAFIQGGMRDPWGSPYMIDENEDEYPEQPCRHDMIYSAGPDGLYVAGGDDIGYALPYSIAACTTDNTTPLE